MVALIRPQANRYKECLVSHISLFFSLDEPYLQITSLPQARIPPPIMIAESSSIKRPSSLELYSFERASKRPRHIGGTVGHHGIMHTSDQVIERQPLTLDEVRTPSNARPPKRVHFLDETGPRRVHLPDRPDIQESLTVYWKCASEREWDRRGAICYPDALNIASSQSSELERH